MLRNKRSRTSVALLPVLAAAFIALVLPANRVVASCSDLIFLDTFETGDTSLWTNPNKLGFPLGPAGSGRH